MMGRVVGDERIVSALEGLEFPALKRDIIKHARANGADEDVLSALDEHLGDFEYHDMHELLEAYLQVNLY
jgi:hypothetical protein